MSALGVAAHARSRPDRTAIVAGDRRITYADLDARAGRAAAALAKLGLSGGDRVAIALRNTPEFFEAALGSARLGCEVVPVGWRLKSDEVRYLVEDSGAKVIVAESASESTDGLAVPVLEVGGAYDDALETSGDPVEAGSAAPVRFRYYTSGTTGRPKAVVRRRSTDEAYLDAMLAYPPMHGLTGTDETHLVCGPLYHTAPCAFASYALLLGHTVVLLDHFDAEHCLRAIDAEKVTWTHMVPINFVRILALPPATRASFEGSSMRKILHAAAPCPIDVKREIIRLFPPDVVWEYYGMTEGFATIISPGEWLAKPGSVGRPMSGVHLEIVDDGGTALPAGEVGVVYVSSPRGRFSYGGAPEKTNEAWRGDMFTVGDMGFLDEDGYLFLTDRKQDMIISGGANVYPAEVENVLFGHPAVADVAVLGIPDDEWGEAVHALVELKDAVPIDDLIAYARDRLAHYKCPRTIEVVASLPRDENGKIRKRELRERYWSGKARRI